MVLTTGASVAGGIWDDNDPFGEWAGIRFGWVLAFG
jgi:hypothetical protein